MEDTTNKLNQLLNEARNYIQMHFGSSSTPNLEEYKPPKIHIKLPEKLEIDELVIKIILFPLYLLYIISTTKKERLEEDLKENYKKYYSPTPPNEKRNDWRKNGGFFYQIKNKISLPTWEEFWKKFEKNFHI